MHQPARNHPHQLPTFSPSGLTDSFPMLALLPLHHVLSSFHKLRHYQSSAKLSPRPSSNPSPSPSKMPNLLDLDDDILQTIFENLLSPVLVSNNKRISASAIAIAIPLASTCTRLMSIFSRSLTDLEPWTNANITDAGLAFLCTRGTSHIKRLVLRGCNMLHASLPYIARCQAIRTLDLSCVAAVDDAILSRICHGIRDTVQSLLLRRCVRLTDQGIRVVAEQCVNLRALDLGGLVQITDAAVEHVARLRRDTLQILILSWSRRLTDTSLHALADTSLQAVFLRGLRITDAGVEAMIHGIGDSIVALDLLDCPDVSNAVFTGCLQRCPNLRGYLVMAAERRISQNCVALLTGYVHVIGGVSQYGHESTVVCVVDAGSANALAFRVLSGEALTLDSDDVKVIATNSGVTLTMATRRFLKRSFGIEV